MSHLGGQMMREEMGAPHRTVNSVTKEGNSDSIGLGTAGISDANGHSRNVVPTREAESVMKTDTIHSHTSSRRDYVRPELRTGNPSTTSRIAIPPRSETSFSSTSGGDQKDSSEDDGKPPPKKKISVEKLDRSKLRKGKWTTEEEEYSSRVVHHFSTGLLTLPEGTTLRSYLAQRLNCDPMRITKKYAGASCLGKRVHHLCNGSPATVADIEMAKAELIQLEHRFRIRVERGQSEVPLPPRAEILPGASTMLSQQWLQGLSTMNASAPGAYQIPQHLQAAIGAPGAWTGLSPHLLAPNSLFPTSPQTMPAMPASIPNDALTTWAWAQAAASLTPALSQLAAANLLHHQQLQKAYEAQLQTLSQNSLGATAPLPASPVALTNMSAKSSRVFPTKAVAHQAADSLKVEVKEAPKVNSKSDNSGAFRPRSQEDQAAGSMLMGFLSSLRKGYEDALKSKDRIETETKASEKSSLSGQKRPATSDKESPLKETRVSASHRVTPAPSTTTTERTETLSATTSYRADSSLEDFMSSETDKGKDPSSSEDSDKDSSGERGSSEEQVSSEEHVYSEERGSGPPRKRMKGKNMVGEFTRKNVAKYNHTTTAKRTETSSGTMSYRADSSLEDFMSSATDKGKDPSSSEDSDKDSSGERSSSEEQVSSEEHVYSEERGSGPPRKRMKGKDMVGEFTRKNVAKHNHRMDAMCSRITANQSRPNLVPPLDERKDCED